MGRQKSSFSGLISLLKAEADLLPIQISLLKERKIAKVQRRKGLQKISELWTSYEDHGITTSALLRRLADLYHPIY